MMSSVQAIDIKTRIFTCIHGEEQNCTNKENIGCLIAK